MMRSEEIALLTGASSNRVTFELLYDCRIEDELVAYVRGIEVGFKSLTGHFRRGAIVDLPINYFPWVDLPAEVRFSLRSNNADFAKGLLIKTYDDAISLVGVGELEVERVRIANGYVRGVVINRINGLVQPQLHARVNSRVPRAVHLEQPRLIDGGGAECQFAVQVHAADVLESGCTIEIYSATSGMPVYRVAYSRDTAWNGAPVLSTIEQQVSQMEQTIGFQIQSLNNESRERIGVLEERIDAFIEYISSMVFDKIATETTEVPSDDISNYKHLAPKIEVLKRAISQAELPTRADYQSNGTALVSVVEPPAPVFSYGWYSVENDGVADFRWMSSSGIVFNPQPSRPVNTVDLVVRSVYGAERPSIRCYFDHLPARIEEQSHNGQPPFKLRLSWTDGDGPRLLQAVRIESEVSASPAAAENSDDARILSISLSEVAFTYDS